LWRLFYKLNIMPTDINVRSEIAQLKAKLETTYIELWDYIENTLNPIRNRLESRLRRRDKSQKKEEEDLKDLKPKKKGGLITPKQYKEYGFN